MLDEAQVFSLECVAGDDGTVRVANHFIDIDNHIAQSTSDLLLSNSQCYPAALARRQGRPAAVEID